MKVRNLITGLCFALSLSAFAEVGEESVARSTLFDTVGAIDSFQWAPARYENNFK